MHESASRPAGPLPDSDVRTGCYAEAAKVLRTLLEGEDDWIAAMATTANVLDEHFSYFHWTGFYRAVSDDLLIVGPYQGSHGCLRISFDRGVCGAAARTRKTQLVPDVEEFPGHIACSSSTRSEIVVPVLSPRNRLLAVLDVDSDHPAAFDAVDQDHLEAICRFLGAQYADTPIL